jgi:phospholipid/cholesterol/gamma-HCH transport system substrate-binding protein
MESHARYMLIGIFVFLAILGGFGFVYWLNTVGGLGDRAMYTVRFENSVSGLRSGAAVLFNGVRVGEVAAVTLNRDDPHHVLVTVNVARDTPIRADSQARVELQGLMGSPALSIQGGTPASPLLAPSPGGASPVIVAGPSAGLDLTQAARETLGRIDTILADNSKPLHDLISNVDSFAAALARNSDRVDGILAGLEKMTGGAGKPPLPTYTLAAVTAPQQRPRKGARQLVVADPTTLVAYDTQRIILRNSEGGTSFLDKAQWADSLPKIFQAMIIESLENSNSFSGVGRPSDGLDADYQLLIDIRAFEVDMGPPAKARIDFEAKLISKNGRVINARDFHAEAPVKSIEPAAVTEALKECFARSVKDLVFWAAQTA